MNKQIDHMLSVTRTYRAGAFLSAGLILCCLQSTAAQRASAQEERRVERIQIHRTHGHEDIRAEFSVRSEANGEVEALLVTDDLVRSAFWLGVECQPASDSLRSHLDLAGGLLIESIAPDSPASRYGLERFDVIVEFAGQPVSNIPQLADLIDKRGDHESNVRLIRNGTPTQLTLRAEMRPPMELSPTVMTVDATDDNLPFGEPFQRVIEHFRGDQPHHQLQMVFVRPGMIVGRAPVKIERELRLEDNRILRVIGRQDGPIELFLRDDEKAVLLDANQLAALPENVQRAAAIEVQRLRWLDSPVDVAGQPVRLFPPQPFMSHHRHTEIAGDRTFNVIVSADPLIAQHPNIQLKMVELHVQENGDLDDDSEVGIKSAEARLRLRIELLESQLNQTRRELARLVERN